MTTSTRAKPHEGRRAFPKFGAVCAAVLLPLAGCMPEVTLETDAQKVSYGKGLEVGRSMGSMADSLHLGALLLGLTAGLDGLELQVSPEEIEAAHARLFGEASEAAELGSGTEEADAGEGNEAGGGAAGDMTDSTGHAPEG